MQLKLRCRLVPLVHEMYIFVSSGVFEEKITAKIYLKGNKLGFVFTKS